MPTDDLDGIRAVLNRQRPVSMRWQEKLPLVVQACKDAMTELAKVGLDGFVETLHDGRVVFAVITSNHGRPCLLIGPTATSHTNVDIAYSTTIRVSESATGFELGPGAEIQSEVAIEELNRTAVLQAIEQFLATEVVA